MGSICGARHQQRRWISRWFREQWSHVKLKCGGLPPAHAPVSILKDPTMIRESVRRAKLRTDDQIECRNSYVAKYRMAELGFENLGHHASVDDVKWIGDGQKTVSLIWDIHNKPEGMDPSAAARRTVEIAGVFGKVVERTAYASKRMLCYLPIYNREYAKVRDFRLENGDVVEGNLTCELCKHKTGHHDGLVNHFRREHEWPRTRKIYNMSVADEKRKADLRRILLYEEEKYKRAARRALTPRVLLPDGLPIALIKAGYFVKQMPDKPPKAPDMAIWSHILQVTNLGVNCICLVCDNVNYAGAVEYARRQNVHTVLLGIGARQVIKDRANLWFSWEEIVTGKAMAMAEQAAASWAAKESEPGRRKRSSSREENPGKERPFAVQEDDMFFDYYENLYPSSGSESEFEWSDSDDDG